MQASETKLRQLIEGTKQYVVPLFQRPYSWSEKQWKTLWVDVLEKARHTDGRPHFFGSIVTTPAKSVPQGVGKYLLVDGQQRLTTVQVLLAAIRDVAGSLEATLLRDRIAGQYLANTYETGDERLKVLPTQDDRAAFRAIIWGHGVPPGRLQSCYQFFRARLEKLSADELDCIHLASVDRLSLVSITCDEHDNPHLIFESLNAKGEKLTPADLIRNYLLMQVHVGDQDRLFKRYWLPVQQALDADLTEFVRHYLMKEGKILREAEVYFELKDRLASSSPAQAEAFLKDLHRHGMFYSRFVSPEAESDHEIAERLGRVRRLKVTVAYPFLLRVFDAFDTGLLNKDQVLQTLDLIESFIIRRAVCNIPTNQLRRMFPPVFDATGGPGPTFLDGLRRQLGGQRCPDDNSFTSALASEPLYATSEKNTRLRLILERLERSFAHKEPADLSKASIEHILPQTPTQEWLGELGDEATGKWGQVVHTLGNLTLSAYNAELSNQPFAIKRKALVESHFVLNEHFKNIDRWTDEKIRERGASLAQRALQVWPDVGRIPGSIDREKRPDQRPIAVRFRGIEQPCRNWRDGFVKLVRSFETGQPGLLAQLTDDEALYAVVSKNPSRFARSKAQIGDVFVNTHASAAQLRDWLEKLAERGGFSEEDYGFVICHTPGPPDEK
jgi:uncharacterized protein with ParB-like and HNH nuclease domain